MLSVLDLFCGAGGFSHGFSSVFKGKHLAIDIDPFSLGTYSHNYPESIVLQRDVSSVHANEIIDALGSTPDIIIASPPCEEYSRANPTSENPAIERIYGTGTARLLLDTIRLIGDLSPKAYIIENVAALLQGGGKRIVQRELRRVGIDDMRFNLVRSHQHGNPSKRLRLFISNLEFHLPRRQAPTVMESIGDLPSFGISDLLSCPEPIPNHVYNTVSDEKMKQIHRTAWGRGIKYFRVSRGKTVPNWVRLYPNKYASSIIGLSRYIHPYEDRLLTVREHARLMSYPDDYLFLGPLQSQYNQVGESVPPLISHLITEEVKSNVE